MKCGALVRYEQRKTKNGEPKFKKNGDPMMRQTHCITPFSEIMDPGFLDDRPKSDFVVCQGKIKVKLEEGYSCDCGYMSSDFEVSYECSECGNSYFPELPTSLSELEEFLQETIDGLSETKRKRRLDDRVEQERKMQKQRDEWLAKNA
jgi:hypothetical protein